MFTSSAGRVPLSKRIKKVERIKSRKETELLKAATKRGEVLLSVANAFIPSPKTSRASPTNTSHLLVRIARRLKRGESRRKQQSSSRSHKG